MSALSFLWVGLGGALGSLARWWVAQAMLVAFGPEFPWGTVLANLSGCLLIGFVAGASGPDGRLIGSSFVREFVVVGICGGYTTFSSFSLQTVGMLQAGDLSRAAANVAVSLIGCIGATFAGYALAGVLTR
jgi:fluoride exporter